MNIGLHIAELLEELGKVSVQGVGTFYLKKTDAYFDEDRQMFFPRDRKLTFKLFEEDSLVFSKYISKAEDISSVAANHVIKEFANKFNTALGTSGTAEIRGIGKLKKEGSEYVIDTFTSYGLVPLPDSGSVVFETDAPDFGKEAPSFKKFVQEEKVKAIVEEIPVPKEVVKEETPVKEEVILQEPEIIEEKLPLVEETPVPEEILLRDEYFEKEEIPTANVPEPEEKELPEEAIREIFKGNYDGLFSNVGDTDRRAPEVEESERQGSPWLKWLIIAVAVLLVAGSVLGYLFYPRIKTFVSNYRSENVAIDTAVIVPQQIVPTPVDSLADSLLNKQTDSIIAAAAKSTSSKADSVTSGSVTYEIIVASFALKSEADNYVSQWTAKGQAVHIIERPLRTFKFKISAGSFTDQAAAQNQLSSVQKTINKEAWIDQVKN